MKYNSFYFQLFRGTMKKVLTERYGQDFARDTMKKACNLYKNLSWMPMTSELEIPWPITSYLRLPL